MKHLHYIIIGVITLTMGAGITSCSHDLDDLTLTEEINDTYNRIFVETFGQPAPNHNWGFSNDAALSRMTRAENANGNEWADISNSTGFGGWKVPDTLTNGQKTRAMAYFQANPNLTYQDPHLRNFFVQQVYKGATNVGEGAKSSETVVAADNSTYNSNNMNLMTVGQGAVHINNFNYGDCSVYGNVLNNGSNLDANNKDIKGYHSDKIMLMVDIDDTSCFGYHETGSSNELTTATGQHNDRAALVAASVIDAWAYAHRDSLVSIGRFGEDVVDQWNRSFLGYDLAIKEDGQIYSGETQNFIEGTGQGYAYLYYGDNDIRAMYEFEDPTHANNNWNWKLKEAYQNAKMTDVYGNPLRLLDSKTNFYSGDLLSFTDDDLKINKFKSDELGESNTDMLNMVFIDSLIRRGYYPVSGSALKTWVKPKHSYDGYYSDWIVTLTQAERVDNTVETDEEVWGNWVRIIAEDLSITSRSDLDFNDVVFDVRINNTKTKAQIKLKAAGGTLPLTVGWSGEAGTSYSEYEVHNMYQVATNIMVNTNARNGVNCKADVINTLTGTFNSANDVKVMVQKRGEWIEITAHTGEPASKIQVKPNYQWCNERRNIGEVYNGTKYAKSFNDYVSDPSVASDWYE